MGFGTARDGAKIFFKDWEAQMVFLAERGHRGNAYESIAAFSATDFERFDVPAPAVLAEAS